MKEVIFVGWINKGRPPVDGETTKNQFIIAELEKHCKVTVLDFYRKNRHPWIYLQALWAFITRPAATLILSTSAKNVYAMLKAFKTLHVRRDIIHWVIGGSFGKQVQEGRFRADVFNYVKYNLVQCHQMIEELEQAGITNARFVSNFKTIPYYPDMEKAIDARKQSKQTRFVFLSRIMQSKGCDYLMEAVQLLNDKGYGQQFSVDFYGKTDPAYRETFLNGVRSLGNVTYKGQLDLRSPEGYDVLAGYHAMLFPTIHLSEGFSGVFIDAFVAALPVLASDWAYNAEIITDGENGLLYAAGDAEALAKAMEQCITGQADLQLMARQARAKADQCQAEKALSEAFLHSIELLKE